MIPAKIEFLQNRLVKTFSGIPSGQPPLWGKMSLQQMIEHFSESVKIASGRFYFSEVITPEAHLVPMRKFLEGDKPFRENTVNPLMPVVPAPVKNLSVEKALDELRSEIDYFFEYFDAHPVKTTRNPIFGDLNFEQNVHLLYKHALHHLRQFGVEA